MKELAADASKFVAYYRVSTTKQGTSGLGLDAQKETVASHVKRVGGKLLAEFTEVESGGRDDRPQLQAALGCARMHHGTLLVAKLDRLSRSVRFLATLLESKADFAACDLPSFSPLIVHVLAAVAQYERQAISERTIAALRAAKAGGAKLGSARPGHWQGKEVERLAGLAKARKAAARLKKQVAQEADLDIEPLLRELRDQGLGLRRVAHALNERHIPARRGGTWSPGQVACVLRRLHLSGNMRLSGSAGEGLAE